MTTKRKRQAAQPQRPQATGAMTPPVRIAGATVFRTLSEDMEIGPCTYAMQILPTGAVLLLFDRETGPISLLLGEENNGFEISPSKVDLASDEGIVAP